MSDSNYEELQKKYNNLRIQFKKQKRKNRKVNRRKYHLAREEAAKSSYVNDIYDKFNKTIKDLHNKLKDKTDTVENLIEECVFWKEQHSYTYQKYVAALATTLSGVCSIYFIIRGIENCVCE
jgi:predicted RNase H-like nuclease (RuvC/YqgF family)